MTEHPTWAGTVRSSEFAAHAGATELSVEVHRIPAIARWVLSEQALLERAARDLVSDAGGRETAAQPASLDGRSGWQVAYRVEPDTAGLARLLLVDERLYIVAARGPGPVAADGAVARFFDSFRAW